MQGEFQFILHEPNFNKELYHEKPTLSTRLYSRTNSLKKGGEKKENTQCVNLVNNQNPFSHDKKKNVATKKKPFEDRKNEIFDHSPLSF
jgi:hypothetical protein